jgi:hypothetical protein
MSPLPITNNLLNEQSRACFIRPRPIRLLSLAAGLLLLGWMEAYADLPPGDPLDLKRLQAKEETNRLLEEEKRQLEQQQAEAKRQAEQAAEACLSGLRFEIRTVLPPIAQSFYAIEVFQQ